MSSKILTDIFKNFDFFFANSLPTFTIDCLTIEELRETLSEPLAQKTKSRWRKKYFEINTLKVSRSHKVSFKAMLRNVFVWKHN